MMVALPFVGVVGNKYFYNSCRVILEIVVCSDDISHLYSMYIIYYYIICNNIFFSLSLSLSLPLLLTPRYVSAGWGWSSHDKYDELTHEASRYNA